MLEGRCEMEYLQVVIAKDTHESFMKEFFGITRDLAYDKNETKTTIFRTMDKSVEVLF